MWCVVGQALYLHRALVWDPALTAVIAHELGHLNSLDGRLTLALRRLAPFASLGEDRATLAEGIAVLFVGGISGVGSELAPAPVGGKERRQQHDRAPGVGSSITYSRLGPRIEPGSCAKAPATARRSRSDERRAPSRQRVSKPPPGSPGKASRAASGRQSAPTAPAQVASVAALDSP